PAWTAPRCTRRSTPTRWTSFAGHWFLRHTDIGIVPSRGPCRVNAGKPAPKKRDYRTAAPLAGDLQAARAETGIVPGYWAIPATPLALATALNAATSFCWNASTAWRMDARVCASVLFTSTWAAVGPS